MGGTALWFAKRRVRTGDEFMLAGQSLPLWVMMGTLLATWVGSGTVVGGAAFTYEHGPLATIFFYAGVPIGILIEPGMVFSVEPAVFIPGLGRFRHSDTAIVTETGHRITTPHPDDLESMTF